MPAAAPNHLCPAPSMAMAKTQLAARPSVVVYLRLERYTNPSRPSTGRGSIICLPNHFTAPDAPKASPINSVK